MSKGGAIRCLLTASALDLGSLGFPKKTEVLKAKDQAYLNAGLFWRPFTKVVIAAPRSPGTFTMPSRLTRREIVSQSPLQIYLQAINETPLLSAEEEKKFARSVAQGDPMAREHMVKANLRLVVNIARGYLGKGLGLEDLIEEGNLGLLRAVEGFDGSMDTRFSTYASYWIKQSIRRAVMNTGKPIRLPAYMVSLLSKWRRAVIVLSERLGRTPTPDEVGRALRLSKKKVGIVAKAIRVNNLTPHPESAEDDGLILGEVLTDDRSRPPDDLLIEADDLDRILLRLGQLEDREAAVIRMRFGLDPFAPMTLREVGERLGLTRERVRQLENQALLKLSAGLDEE
jgi:RNA polymerase primary sigma factor